MADVPGEYEEHELEAMGFMLKVLEAFCEVFAEREAERATANRG